MVTSQRIKQVRARLGESQEAFAARFGVDQSTVHRWESVGVPDRGTAAHALQQFLNELGEPEAA